MNIVQFVRESFSQIAKVWKTAPEMAEAVADESLICATTELMRLKLAAAREKGRGGWWDFERLPYAIGQRELKVMLISHLEREDYTDCINIAAMLKARQLIVEGETDGIDNNQHCESPMWEWFGLSYSAYLVLPRVLICGMPHRWQLTFRGLLEEAQNTYDSSSINDNYTVLLRDDSGKLVKDPYRHYRHFPKSALPYREKPAGADGE